MNAIYDETCLGMLDARCTKTNMLMNHMAGCAVDIMEWFKSWGVEEFSGDAMKCAIIDKRLDY